MPNTVEQDKNTIEFSPIVNQDEATNKLETIKDNSQMKKTSFTERIDAMVGMKPRVEEATTASEKSKTFGTVSTITTETRKGMGEAPQVTAVSPDERTKETRTTSAELGDLMTKLNKIDKKLKCSEEDRLELKKEIRHYKNENLDNYFCLARATEDKLQQMSDEVGTTDK